MLYKKQSKMETIHGFIQVYNVWLNGRDIDDNNQHFPIHNGSIETNTNWHSDFKKAANDYLKVKVKDSDGEHGFYSEIYSDYHVALYSIEIDIADFEKKHGIKFDLENEDVQEIVPYYVDYDFNTVAERVSKFKK